MQKSLLLPLFIIILSVQPIFALEFDIIDFKPDPLDFHGRSYSVKDMNADLCALLRVESDLTGELYITDVPIEKREKKKDAVGIWYFYMSFRERHVTFTSKGYSPLTWKIPERMERGKVYIVRIRTKGEKQPEGLGNLRIETEPPGCTIFLNEVKLADTTPVTLENQPAGVHRIRIEKDDDYLPVDTLLTIRDKETTNFKHRLILSYGILSITSQPSNANATLLDDNIDLGLTPINDIRINPGALKIRIEKDGYDPFEKIIELDYGERRSVEAKLIRQVGSLDVSTIPEGAKIYLDGKYYGTTPSEVKGVPTGAYEIKLDKAGYDLQLDRIEIKRNEVTEHTRTLSKAGMREWRKRRLKAMLMSSVVPGGG
ncbi:MAG: PEGA domain-containing protein, partial [Candidatus Hatepunaea meridiana]|nr:PEGA domain-containing protein [Candidatus Hatepunaea meridiana]